ncbi:MAG: hypothetical protein C4K49_04080 [Candidatus Thorarchaeota archaeon]|nr:MAG: hypothetical protein C4K49_04080 [Candidatus Thorarchaeota archaeon]
MRLSTTHVPAHAAKEVTRISTDRMRTIYESMTTNRIALRLLSVGIVRGMPTVVQPPCEDPTPF